MSTLSRRKLLGSAGAGLLLAPFLSSGMRKEAQAAGSPVKRLILFCTMGTHPPAWTPTGASPCCTRPATDATTTFARWAASAPRSTR